MSASRIALFESRVVEYALFMKRNGGLPPANTSSLDLSGKSQKTRDYYSKQLSLRNWLNYVQRCHRNGTLSDEKIMILDDYLPEWRTISRLEAVKEQAAQECLKWLQMHHRTPSSTRNERPMRKAMQALVNSHPDLPTVSMITEFLATNGLDIFSEQGQNRPAS